MTIAEELKKALEAKIASYKASPQSEHIGKVTAVGDGIALIDGLSRIGASEMIDFGEGRVGVALNLEEEQVGAIILGDDSAVRTGDTVKAMGKILSVPVGEQCIGRVISPLGEPQDGGPPLHAKTTAPIEKIAPGVMMRSPVSIPLQTGIKAIDALTPIGRGQRELIIGDRQTGKTAIVLDTIVNQKRTQHTDRPVICIYVAIGQKEATVARIVSELKEKGAMDYTIVVASSASDPSALAYLAPFAGCAMGEYFLAQGKDVLCIYDDLSKHAWAYRQISLLLRRPPGREAYPGDVFYLHSRLLERACCLDQAHGGGTLTALPVIETQAGNVSDYIPTNVISITDGQIFLEADLFHKGIRPAINAGISVSRVGSAAQVKSMKKVAGRVRLDLAQYRELAVFSQFGAEIDVTTKRQLDRGARLTEILKQPRFATVSVGEQVASLYAGIHGEMDDIPLTEVHPFERAFLEHLRVRHPDLLEILSHDLPKDAEERLKRLIASFREEKGYGKNEGLTEDTRRKT